MLVFFKPHGHTSLAGYMSLFFGLKSFFTLQMVVVHLGCHKMTI